MPMLTVRNIDEALKAELRITAAKQGVSMEEQVRIILRKALFPKEVKKGLGSRIHQRFSMLSKRGIDTKLAIPLRSMPRKAPDFTETRE